MLFANPWGLLALLGLPLLVYVHRRAPAERRLVPLVSLWRPGAAPAARASRRNRIDPLLLLRLAVVVAIALALARPGWPAPAPRRHAIVVDASASMSTREETGPRFRHALDEAARVLARIPPEDEALIVRGGTPPTLIHPASRDRAALETALFRLAPGEAAKDLGPGLGVAQQALAGKPGLVHLVSDVRDPDGLAPLARRLGLAPDRLRVHRVGGPADNVAIVALDSAPLAASPLDLELFVEVANFSSRPRPVDLALFTPEGRREGRRLSLAPGERKPITLVMPSAPWIEARLEGAGDALAADDRAVLVTGAGPLRVLYSGSDRFVDAALRAHPRVAIRRVSAAELGSERWSPGIADVAVVEGTAPPGLPLPALVFRSDEPGQGRSARAVPVVDWQRSHPLLRRLDLSEVAVPAGVVLSEARLDALVSSADGPVVSALAGPPRRVEIAFAVGRSNLGRLPAFPVFVARALDWLANRDGRVSLTVKVGEPLRVALAESPPNLTVHRPDGSTERVAATGGAAEFRGTDLAGLYEAEGRGVRLLFAANLLDAEESNVDRPRVATPDAGFAPSAAAVEWRDLSPWLLALGLALLSLEIWLTQRRHRPA
ncbi:MAG TPA: VWA domain-containing protein [Methylomirabilota bacterium]|jgi:hypothetical protein|nr:VWA domain-containing protein [Methylomirabilota bacterium]